MKLWPVTSTKESRMFSNPFDEFDKSPRFWSLLIPTLWYDYDNSGRDTGFPAGSEGYSAIIVFSYLS